ncbi:MAG: DNA cytosine methyltransferase [Faecousia sp.]
MSDLTHLSLFSGIGGLDLAAEWAGFRTVGQCEWADYPRAVLEKHWPVLPRWRDIRTLTGDDFYAKTGMRTVDVISGGFPCQPFSTAGKRRGKDDDRYLWPEMLRVISEIRPAWVVGENVAGIVSMALDTVLSDLESIGYSCQALVIPACAVDAPHRRDRVAIVANDSCIGLKRMRGEREQVCKSQFEEKVSDGHRDFMLPDTTWWNPEPNVCRVVHGVPSWVDRLKSLGNAVVPQQFYPIFRAIADLEVSQWENTQSAECGL